MCPTGGRGSGRNAPARRGPERQGSEQREQEERGDRIPEQRRGRGVQRQIVEEQQPERRQSRADPAASAASGAPLTSTVPALSVASPPWAASVVPMAPARFAPPVRFVPSAASTGAAPRHMPRCFLARIFRNTACPISASAINSGIHVTYNAIEVSGFPCRAHRCTPASASAFHCGLRDVPVNGCSSRVISAKRRAATLSASPAYSGPVRNVDHCRMYPGVKM